MAPQAGKNAGEWQPIETAPKQIVRQLDDIHRYGEEILVALGKSVFRARWWDASQHGDPRACNFLDDGGRAVKPTHWMPLPPPPVVRA